MSEAELAEADRDNTLVWHTMHSISGKDCCTWTTPQKWNCKINIMLVI